MFKTKFNPNPKKFHCIPLYIILKKKKITNYYTKFHSSNKRDRIVWANQCFSPNPFFYPDPYLLSQSVHSSTRLVPLSAKRIAYDHSRRIKVSLAGLKKKKKRKKKLVSSMSHVGANRIIRKLRCAILDRGKSALRASTASKQTPFLPLLDSARDSTTFVRILLVKILSVLFFFSFSLNA